MIEHYIYLLAKSYFWVFTIFFILSLIAFSDKDYKSSRENKKLEDIKNGKYHISSIRAIIYWTLYFLSILIYFKL